MSQVFKIPLVATLKSKGSHDRGNLGGDFFELLKGFKEHVEWYLSSLEARGKIDSSLGEPGSWYLCNMLGFNMCSIKVGLVYDCHTLNAIGFANKWQNSPDAILTALDLVVGKQ